MAANYGVETGKFFENMRILSEGLGQAHSAVAWGHEADRDAHRLRVPGRNFGESFDSYTARVAQQSLTIDRARRNFIYPQLIGSHPDGVANALVLTGRTIGAAVRIAEGLRGVIREFTKPIVPEP